MVLALAKFGVEETSNIIVKIKQEVQVDSVFLVNSPNLFIGDWKKN